MLGWKTVVVRKFRKRSGKYPPSPVRAQMKEIFEMLLEPWLLGVVPRTAAAAAERSLLKCRILGPTPDLINQNMHF